MYAATTSVRRSVLQRLQRGSLPGVRSYHAFATRSDFYRSRWTFDDGTLNASSSRRDVVVAAPRVSAFFSTDEKTTTKEDDDVTSTMTSPPPESESMSFRAETRQLLDIVTHSLYTDKEIFLRELVSNASDALEKLRHVRDVGSANVVDSDRPLEIRIETDEAAGTLTVTDTGIGLTKAEMVENLGTVARSGSKDFVKSVSEGSEEGAVDDDAARGIIGRFGVGFYSAFMVGDSVEVRSVSAIAGDDSSPLSWTSDGVGSFTVAPLADDVRQHRGSSIVISLKDDALEFADEKRIERVLKKYSNFVNFPIHLNGNRVNTVEAVWAKDPKEVDEATHAEFYKFVSNGFDVPLSTLHYRADAPLEIRALLYVPSFHSEKHGMGRLEPGVSLYSRRVLIESKSKDILPDWLRFVKGVVDSEDLPLSLSREKPQDSALVAKLRRAVTRRFISHLSTMARKESDKYKTEFYNEYSFFLKEGICQDFEFQEPLSKLLYFETSKTMDGELSSFDEYISRCPPTQDKIYYIVAPNRNLALASPYLETFERSGTEVLLVYSAIDDFVMSNLQKYEGRELVSAEKGDIDEEEKDDDNKTDEDKKEDAKDGEDEKKDDDSEKDALTPSQSTEFCAWFTATLSDKVQRTKITNRLVSSPAVVTDHESGALRRMMRMVDTQDGGGTGRGAMPLSPQTVEVNPAHPVIVGLYRVRSTEPELARVCAEQVFDNCLVAAGLLDDGRTMLPRLNDLLESLVNGAASTPDSGDATATKTKTEEPVVVEAEVVNDGKK